MIIIGIFAFVINIMASLRYSEMCRVYCGNKEHVISHEVAGSEDAVVICEQNKKLSTVVIGR